MPSLPGITGRLRRTICYFPENDSLKTVLVIIETPKNSPVKFDFDKKLNLFKLKKSLPSGMVFPYDFGFFPGTKGEDGDPVDVIAISEFKTFPGCAMECRIIGGLTAEQQEGKKTIRNDRLVAVPVESAVFNKVEEIDQFPNEVVEEIKQFFMNYNFGTNKQLKVTGIIDSKAALKIIKKSLDK